MDISTTASSRRPSQSTPTRKSSGDSFYTARGSLSESFHTCQEPPEPNPKYKQLFATEDRWHPSPKQRIDADAYFKQEQSSKINKAIMGTQRMNGSYFFRVGKQVADQRFQEVFVGFFREMRGADPLARKSASSLADKFRGYPDVSRREDHTMDAGDFSDIEVTEYRPTAEIIDELKQILEDEHGMKDQFLGVLVRNSRKISDSYRFEDRDTCWKGAPLLSRAFPRCVDTLQKIFESLLLSKWLQNDIDGVKLYLDANDYVDRPIPSLEEINFAITLWETAKDHGEKQRKRDTEIEAKHWNEFQNDLWGTMFSGGLSICTVNPAPVIAKAAHTMMNVLSNQVDPEGNDKRVQVLKMFGGVGLGGALGGNPWDLGTSLGIDLVELAVRDEKTTKGESALLGLWGNTLKGLLTGDQKKLICQILGGCVAEAVNQLPETDENTSLKRRIARALLTNSDVQAHFIKGFVDKRFKDDPKPKTGGELTPEEQEKYPKQEPTLEDLKQQAEYEKQLAEYEKCQKDVKIYEQESANRQEVITQKEVAVKQAETKMLKLWGKYQKAQGAFSSGDKEFNAYWKKRETYEKLSGELNTLKAHQGLPQEDPFKKFIRKPSPPKGIIGVLDRAYDKTCDVAKKIGFSGEVPVTSVPLYTTRPSTVSDRHVPRETFSRPQVNQPRSNLGWENVQAMQIEQMFNANMQRSVENSGVIGNNFQAPNYQLSLVRDLAPNMQLPPTDFSNLGRNEIVPYQNSQRNIPIQMAGFVPFQPMIEPSEAMHSLIANDFTKSLPKGALKVMAAVCTLMLPDMSDVKGAEDPREHFKRTFNYGLKKYDRFVDIQDPNSFGAKAGEFVGEMVALGGVGKVIRVAEGISIFGMACEGGFVGAVMSEAHDTNMVAGVAFGFVGGGVGAKLLFRGGCASRPLLDRTLVMPQGFGKQVRAIQAFHQPALSSGLSFPKLGLMPGQHKLLAERTVLKLEGLGIKASKGINRSNNHQFITWVESGQTRTASIGEMSHAGTFHDRGGLSKAGRALDKHGRRIDTVFPKATGNIHEKNMQGQRVLDEILDHPQKRVVIEYKARFGEVIDVWHPSGHGARFTKDGKEFITLLEPNK
jgi:hypothetical protein